MNVRSLIIAPPGVPIQIAPNKGPIICPLMSPVSVPEMEEEKPSRIATPRQLRPPQPQQSRPDGHMTCLIYCALYGEETSDCGETITSICGYGNWEIGRRKVSPEQSKLKIHQDSSADTEEEKAG